MSVWFPIRDNRTLFITMFSFSKYTHNNPHFTFRPNQHYNIALWRFKPFFVDLLTKPYLQQFRSSLSARVLAWDELHPVSISLLLSLFLSPSWRRAVPSHLPSLIQSLSSLSSSSSSSSPLLSLLSITSISPLSDCYSLLQVQELFLPTAVRLFNASR